MSYIINKTDGSVLTEIVDGTIDQTATDITLVGKNSSSYGELVNENFIHILENFANTSSPNHPIIGQLWYDTSEGRLKVYDGNGFKVSGGTIVSGVTPSMVQGDLWIDSNRQQLYFNDGLATILAGPIYTRSQGISGLQAVDVLDTNTIEHTIVLVYVARVLIGIFSKDAFTPASPISGYTGDINIGFNVSNYSGVKFDVPVTSSSYLIAADQSLKNAESFLSTTDSSGTSGSITIANETPLILGVNQNIEIHVDSNAMQINSNIANQDYSIYTLNVGGLLPAQYINAQDQFVGIYTDLPTATLDVNGDTRIRGSLTVEGDLTTINTINVQIEDKLIDLGKTDTPDNTTADGGGINLQAGIDGDKSIIWVANTTAWTSSEHIDIATGKGYHVNGFEVLTQTALGVTVNSAPGLQSVGTLTSLQVDYLYSNDNSISYVNPVLANGDIVLVPKGSGAVNVSNKKITNLADPTDPTDGVNYESLLYAVQTAPLALSINVGLLTNQQIALTIITKVYPPSEHQDGAICRVWCIDTASAKQFTLSSGAWGSGIDI
jgi:hypothetical protein